VFTNGLPNTGVTLSSGTVTDLSIDGQELTVILMGATDDSTLVMSFPGIADQFGNLSTDAQNVLVLLGDAQGDFDVDLQDFWLFTQCATAAMPVDQSCASSDFINDGVIDVGNDHSAFVNSMTGPR
jgi:hypothetical protein